MGLDYSHGCRSQFEVDVAMPVESKLASDDEPAIQQQQATVSGTNTDGDGASNVPCSGGVECTDDHPICCHNNDGSWGCCTVAAPICDFSHGCRSQFEVDVAMPVESKLASDDEPAIQQQQATVS